MDNPDQRTAGLQFEKIGFDQKERMCLLVCSEAVKSILLKLETRRTLILPIMVSVLYSTNSRL